MSKQNQQQTTEQAEGSLDKKMATFAMIEEKTGFDRAKQEKLIKQIQSEYTFGYDYIKPKWDKWIMRLRLYNNQKRSDESVGDTLLFSVFQTVLAELYIDRLSSEALHRDQGDAERAETWNDLIKFDYDEMERSENDYYWIWDTAFFGRGLLSAIEFDRDTMTPILEVWDPLTVIRDPRAKSVNGDKRGRGGAKFIGREIRLTKNDMKDQGIYFNFEDLDADTKGNKDLIDQAQQARDDAQGRQNTQFKALEGDNADVKILEWITFFDGDLYIIGLGDDRSQIVRVTKLKGKLIPLIDRALFPMSKDWDGVTIPDLIEDKQRARAVLTNLGLKAVKASMHPMYLFNKNKIKNKGDLNFGFNKFIEVDGEVAGAVQPMLTQAVKADAQFILDLLEAGAQQALATPKQKLGMAPSGSPTATEINEVGNQVDTRHSLSAKIFGWSERRFWQRHFRMYQEHYKPEIDTKLVRIVGSMGSELKIFGPEEMKFSTMPDFRIESVALSEAERVNKARRFQSFFQFASKVPEADIRRGIEMMGQFMGLSHETIRTVLPKSGEELKAENENLQIQNGKKVPVSPRDDDRLHLYTHNKLADSPEKYAHMEAHKRALMLKKSQPELFAPQTIEGQVQQAQGATEGTEMLGDPSGGAIGGQQSAVTDI